MNKSGDFEVHERGTATELKMCRDLVSSMAQMMEQYGDGIFHVTIANKVKALLEFYNKTLHNEQI